MSEHERQADRLERELDEMGEQSERLEREIDEARSDWERKKRDPDVPGAADDTEQSEGPEAPSKGD